jgi:hypothetical protein
MRRPNKRAVRLDLVICAGGFICLALALASLCKLFRDPMDWSQENALALTIHMSKAGMNFAWLTREARSE